MTEEDVTEFLGAIATEFGLHSVDEAASFLIRFCKENEDRGWLDIEHTPILLEKRKRNVEKN